MNCNSTTLSYADTGYFSKIILDYLAGEATLRPFYKHPVSTEGIAASIEERKQFNTNRQLLVSVLNEQYEGIPAPEAVLSNIELLRKETTFTITTAHQPALFTGTLYFIYKIFHTIRIAADLKQEFPDYNFVPVFYMGSEDADLDELGNFHLDGEKISWNTKQTGAVGRMNTDGLQKLIDRIDGQLSVLPFGKELIEILKECYVSGMNIQQSTFRLVNRLFGEYGLVVLIPDNKKLKQVMVPVFREDLFRQVPSAIVEQTTEAIAKHYKVQANPRPINLFYLHENIRERIEKQGEHYHVVGNDIRFTQAELEQHLQEFPERFSPNVILRGMFQETILPNIAFVGGGGETAYWLELKDLFQHFHVPYPVLVLRNSFLFIGNKWKQKMDRMGIDIRNVFQPEREIFNAFVQKESSQQLTLEEEIDHASAYYDRLKEVAGNIDDTLIQHVSALQSRAIKPLQELQKKLMRAEKRKFEAAERQIKSIKAALFPHNSLQERVENFMPFYAAYGPDFLNTICQHSLGLEQQFVVLDEK